MDLHVLGECRIFDVEPGDSEFDVKLPEVVDKCIDSSSDEPVMMIVSKRLDEGFVCHIYSTPKAVLISQGLREKMH